MRLFRPFFLLKVVFPEAVFRIKTNSKEIYLTFDDGPDQASTPRIIEILTRHKVRATFFCSGMSAETNRALMDLIISEGHIIGNHGYNHPDGFKTSRSGYVEDIMKAAQFTSGTFFRPPFGRIKPSQFRELSQKFKIVFWDLMPYDFDKRMTSEKILTLMKRKVRPGSVIVLHDRENSGAVSVLEPFIEFALKSGFIFKTLPVSGKE